MGYESRMLAARAWVPITCMIWQVVPSTSTRKSINLDLARAAPYRYFTQYGPAHADQNLIQQTFFLASFLSVSLVVLLYGVGRSGWTRRCRAGLLTSPHAHTSTSTRSHTHTHITPTPPGFYSYSSTALILERDIAAAAGGPGDAACAWRRPSSADPRASE